jgi:microsomal dipeptidase-like Zn-dependent dipeptidase
MIDRDLLIRALNRLDVSAEAGNTEPEEAKQQQKDYNVLYDFIKGYTESEDMEMLERENKNLAKALEREGYTEAQISDIANGAI